MVYHGKNDIRVEERVRPTVMEATDAIIKLTKTTICGTDPGIWKGKNRRLASRRTEWFCDHVLLRLCQPNATCLNVFSGERAAFLAIRCCAGLIFCAITLLPGISQRNIGIGT